MERKSKPRGLWLLSQLAVPATHWQLKQLAPSPLYGACMRPAAVKTCSDLLALR